MYLRDNSDWWSIVRTASYNVDVKPGTGAINDSNLQIDGVSLGAKQFDDAQRRFGRASEIERGDASTGRNQK